VFGDVAGHREAFVAGLESVGVDVDRHQIPDDLVVVQVGDLIHKGPDSPGVVELVDAFLRRQSERWIQLIGNHEAQYLGGPWFWDETLPTATLHTIDAWYAGGMVHLATAFSTPEGELLVTHAGLTYERWGHNLEGINEASIVAQELNAWLHDKFGQGFEAGWLLADGEVPHPQPGTVSPLWTDPGHELFPGWAHAPSVPFGQVFGHTAPYRWDSGRWDSAIPRVLIESATLDRHRHHARFEIGGQPFWAIDPGLTGNSVPVPISPLMIPSSSSDHPLDGVR
jgi:hypothetical protein